MEEDETTLPEDDGTVVVYTNSLKLTAAQTSTMNNRVQWRGIGMGAVLVHKITETDKLNGLHTPKRIVSALNIGSKGWVYLAMCEYDNYQECSYYKMTDGRIRFNSGWEKFVQVFDLQVGVDVLVMFHMDRSGYMKVSLDVL